MRRIPGLVIAEASPTLSEPGHGLAAAEICHDARGDVLAYCSAASDTLRVDVPDLASFRYASGAPAATAVPHRPLPPAVLLETYYHCVLPLLLPALGTEVIHASAVRGIDGVAAFCGDSGMGKSTIAVALGRRGYTIWADDAVAVDTASGTSTTFPLPFQIRLRADSARFFADTPDGRAPVVVNPTATGPTSLALLAVLRRVPDASAPVEIERLDVASACRAALGHAYCFSVKDPSQKRRTVQNYLAITARVPVYEIRFPSGLERLDAMLDTIEELIG